MHVSNQETVAASSKQQTTEIDMQEMSTVAKERPTKPAATLTKQAAVQASASIISSAVSCKRQNFVLDNDYQKFIHRYEGYLQFFFIDSLLIY